MKRNIFIKTKLQFFCVQMTRFSKNQTKLAYLNGYVSRGKPNVQGMQPAEPANSFAVGGGVGRLLVIKTK